MEIYFHFLIAVQLRLTFLLFNSVIVHIGILLLSPKATNINWTRLASTAIKGLFFLMSVKYIQQACDLWFKYVLLNNSDIIFQAIITELNSKKWSLNWTAIRKGDLSLYSTWNFLLLINKKMAFEMNTSWILTNVVPLNTQH